MLEYTARRGFEGGEELFDSHRGTDSWVEPASPPPAEPPEDPRRRADRARPDPGIARGDAIPAFLLPAVLIVVLGVAGWAGYGWITDDSLPPNQAALVETITTGQPEEARDAAERLLTSGWVAERTATALAERLERSSVRDPEAAAIALGRLDAPAAITVPALLGLLSHDNPGTRRAAVGAIANTGVEARFASADLAQIASTEPDVAVLAAILEAFARIGATDEASVAAMIVVLDHRDAALRADAAMRLGVIGTPALPAKQKLSLLADQDPEAAVRMRAALAAVAVDPEASVPRTEPLLGLLGDADAAVRALAESALAGAAEGNPEVQSQLLAALRSADPKARAGAAKALGHAKSPGAHILAGLIAALDDGDPAVRRNAAAALGKFGEAAAPAATGLIALLADPDEALQREAYIALKSIHVDSKGTVAGIEDALNDHRLHSELCGHH